MHPSESRLTKARHALATAGDVVPHGRPYDLETDRYQHKPVWDIKVASGKKPEYELYVSAGGGKVVHKHHKDKRDDDAAKALKAQTTLSEALKTADRHAKGHPSTKPKSTPTMGTSSGPRSSKNPTAKTARSS